MKSLNRSFALRIVSLALPALALAAAGACSSGDSGSGGSGGGATGGKATGGSSTGGSNNNTGGSSSGSGGTGGGGTTTGGKQATGGSTSGGSTGGSAGSGGGGSTGGSAGSGSGGSTGGAGGTGTGGSASGGGAVPYRCPAGPFPALQLPSAMPTLIAGAPPSDAFNNSGNDFTNVEGPAWAGNALYVSEIKSGTNPPMSRIVKITADDMVSVAVADAGSNGLAVDADQNLVTANHGVGGIVRINPSTGAKTTLTSSFNGNRFDSPNDLTIRSDGAILFTDPNFQAPTPYPQPNTGVYFLPAGSNMAKLLMMNTNNPNGITLSLDEKSVYIGDGSGVKSYPLSADGTLGTGTAIAASTINGTTDGMVIDCAGNLYVVLVNSHTVVAIDPTGKVVGNPITVPNNGQFTNVAFGGTDHKTLYMTVMGSSGMRGVYKLTGMPIPGMPY